MLNTLWNYIYLLLCAGRVGVGGCEAGLGLTLGRDWRRAHQGTHRRRERGWEEV